MAESSPPQTLNPSHLDDHDSSGQHHHLPPNSESTDGTQTGEKRKRVDLDSEPEQQNPKENQQGEEEAPGDHQEKGEDAGKGQNHPMWKTSLCSYFRRSNGKCNHGETCRYAHGEEELRPRSDNTWDPTSERAKKMLKASSDDGETGKLSSGVLEAEEVMMTETVADGGEPALTKCFVNLPMKWTSDNLKNFLGEQALCFKSAKKKKGMIVGFVSFENADQVRRAIEELDGKSVGNKNLKIVEVIPRSFERKNKEGLPLSQCTQQSDAATATGSMHISESSSRMDDGSTIDESLLRNSSVLRGRSARDVVSPLAHMPYVDQLEQKKSNLVQTLKKLTRNARKACPNGVLLPDWIAKSREIGGLPCKLEGIVESPVVNGYRNKCEFSVGYSVQGKTTVGFLLGNFREGVTAVEEPFDCPNVSMTSCKYASIFQEFLQHSSLPIWNRLNNTGFWRQLTVREGRMPTKDTKVGISEVKISEVMVMVQVCTAGYVDGVVNSELEKMAQAFAVGASANFPSLPLTALVVQDHKGISNAAPADTPLRSLSVPKAEGELELQATGDVGETRIHDYINNLRFCISPTAFFQVNTLAAERLYTLAGDWAALGPDTLLFDICCGTGTIGLTLAHRVGMVVGIEMNASAVSDAYRNAEINGIKNCRFVCAKAEDVMGLLLKEYLHVPQKQNETLNSSEKNDQNSPKPEEGGTCVDNACDSNESSGLMVANGEGTSICLNNGSQVENQHEESSISENGMASIEQFKNVVAIVDPPRVGLHPTVIKALRTHPRLRRLVYVSCNPESLVANAIELCTPSADKIEKGNKNNRGWRNMSSAGLARHRAKSMPNSEPFQPIKAMAVDLFPHTPHCELVLLLER